MCAVKWTHARALVWLIVCERRNEADHLGEKLGTRQNLMLVSTTMEEIQSKQSSLPCRDP